MLLYGIYASNQSAFPGDTQVPGQRYNRHYQIWPWDVVRGMFELTKRDIGAYIEKEVTSDIVDEATSAAIKIAFDRLETQYREQTRWTRNLTITLITVVSTVGAAIVGGIVTYIIKQLT